MPEFVEVMPSGIDASALSLRRQGRQQQQNGKNSHADFAGAVCRAESRHAFSGGYFVARFFQKRSRLSSPPKSEVKMVESASRMSPGRSLVGRHPEKHVEGGVAGFR